MSKVTMIGKISCKDGQSDATEAALRDMTEASKEEPGVEIYTYLRGDENTYWFFGLMSVEAAMQAHGQSDAMKKAMAAFGPLVAAPPEMSVTSPVAANGFDI